MVRPSVFRSETVIEADIETVYAFHENPHNIAQISPRWQTVQVIQAARTAAVGETFHIEVKLFRALTMNWQGVWREAARPGLLVDEMVSGPFRYWRHQHKFCSLGSARTLLTDEVHYQFAGGWLGKLFGETFGRLQFWIMFADRQARTCRRLRENH